MIIVVNILRKVDLFQQLILLVKLSVAASA